MDPIGLGRQLRALRIRKELRQEDIGRIARLSRAVISRIERGMLESVTVGALVHVAAAVGASVDVRVRWNGEQLDRLLDEAHAQLVELVVLLLRASGWEVAVEVSFAVWGERGSIDVFAFHRATGIVSSSKSNPWFLTASPRCMASIARPGSPPNLPGIEAGLVGVWLGCW